MAALNVANACISGRVRTRSRSLKTRISCVTWDPEGILGPAQTGHFARREFQHKLETDAKAREAFQRQLVQEKERRRSLRESRVVPDDIEGLIEYFLDTEAREIEYEIARLRPRLNQEFFSHLKFELGQLRFAVSRTKAMEDRLIELEAIQKVLQEGTEAYDKLQSDVVKARVNLAKILRSEDVKATILEMVGQNELNRPLLTLLDENIANAYESDEKQAALYMERVRAAVVKYMTVTT